MQTLARTLFAIILSLSFAHQAFATGPLPTSSADPDIEVIQETLDPIAADDNGKKIFIRLSKGTTYELDASPDQTAMGEALGLITPENVKAQILKSGGKIEDQNPLDAYNSLSEENKTKFRETRIAFIAGAARVLHATKFAMGVGSILGDGFTFLKTKVKKIIGKETAPVTKEKRSFSVRSEQAVQNILRGLDYKLWYQAPLVIESNEFGVTVSLGLLAETGVLSKGAGGMEEVGISLAYNKSKRAFIFEILHNSENYDNSKAAVAVIGIVGKASPTLARRDNNIPVKGTSFYPPGFPGYTSTSSEFFTAGFSSSIGLPPPPLADVLTYTNTFERRALLRISFSPIVKGFIRIQLGDFLGSGKLVVARFIDIYQAINNKLRPRVALSCTAVFN